MSKTQILDQIQLTLLNLEEALKAFGIMQKRQTILLNIIQRKVEVKDHEIIEEEKRLDAKLKANTGNS